MLPKLAHDIMHAAVASQAAHVDYDQQTVTATGYPPDHSKYEDAGQDRITAGWTLEGNKDPDLRGNEIHTLTIGRIAATSSYHRSIRTTYCNRSDCPPASMEIQSYWKCQPVSGPKF